MCAAPATAHFGVVEAVPLSGLDVYVHQLSVGPGGAYLLATNQLIHVDQNGVVQWRLGQVSDPTSLVGGAQGVAVAPSGLVAVTLPDQGVVRWFDQEGRPVADWSVAGATGIRSVDDTVIVDGAAGLQAFTLDGRFLYRVPYDLSTGPPIARYEFAFDGRGGAWFASLGQDLGDSYVRVGPTGAVAAQITALGRVDGSPHGVGGFTSDARGNLWAADATTGKVYEFDLGGRLVKRCGSGAARNPLANVVDIERSADGSFYAVANSPVRLVHLGSASRPLFTCERPVLRRLRVTLRRRPHRRAAGSVSVSVSGPATVRFTLQRRGRRVASFSVTTAGGRISPSITKFNAVLRGGHYVVAVDATDASGNPARRVRKRVAVR